MTDMQQALTIGGTIFGVMMLTQFGRRHYNLHKIVTPFVTVALVGWFYLKAMPTAGADWAVYGVGAAVGLVFGVVAAAATGVDRDALGKAWTRCGWGFVTAWLAVMALRIAFVALADHDETFHRHLGEFMVSHHIVEGAIAPFFVIMALAMVLVRAALVGIRVRRTPVPTAAHRERELTTA